MLDRIVYAEIAGAGATPTRERTRRPQPAARAPATRTARGLSDEEVRDQVMTLMFAGHDTSTSTLSFLLYELARHPHALARLQAEQDEVLGGAAADAGRSSSASSRISTWSSTRPCASTRRPGSGRAARCATFEFAGHQVPAGAYVNYCSWASHRLPEVFPEPEAFIPERFDARAQDGAPARRLRPVRRRLADLHRQALRPDRGEAGRDDGCSQRLRFELLPGRTMTIRQMPTLSPDGGLEMRVRERAPDPRELPRSPRASRATASLYLLKR